jgi:hypothetical protein
MASPVYSYAKWSSDPQHCGESSLSEEKSALDFCTGSCDPVTKQSRFTLAVKLTLNQKTLYCKASRRYCESYQQICTTHCGSSVQYETLKARN